MAKSRVGKVRKSRIGALLPVEGGGAPSSGLYFFWKKFSKSRSGALLPVISSREPTCGLYFFGKNLTKSRSGALLPVESNREPTCGLYFFWRNLAKSKPTYQEARAEWVRCSSKRCSCWQGPNRLFGVQTHFVLVARLVFIFKARFGV